VSGTHLLSEAIIERPLAQLRIAATCANERSKGYQHNIQ
jgi:hypothetical protein